MSNKTRNRETGVVIEEQYDGGRGVEKTGWMGKLFKDVEASGLNGHL